REELGVDLRGRVGFRGSPLVYRIGEARCNAPQRREPVLDDVALPSLERSVCGRAVRLAVATRCDASDGDRPDAETGRADEVTRIGDAGEVHGIHGSR